MFADHRSTASVTRDGMERTFFIAGLCVQSKLALNSMIHLLNARTKYIWNAIDTPSVDVLFLGSELDEATEHQLVAQATCIVRVANFDSELPGTITRLEYPFRVGQVMNVLEELDEQFCNPASRRAANQFEYLDTPEWDLFESLQTQLNFSSHGQWLVSRYDNGNLLYVRDNFCEFAGEESVHLDLTAGELPRTALAPSTPPHPSLRRGPGMALLWQIGLHSGTGELNKSLDPGNQYQLTSWPDFGVVKAQREHLRMAALLAASPHSRDELAHMMNNELDLRFINRFFNACYASGLMHLVKSHNVVETRIPRSQSSFMGNLVSRIRGKLGFSQHRVAGLN